MTPIPGKCNGLTRKGKLCTKPAGYDTDHLGYGKCKFHTGSTPNGKKSAQTEIAVEAVRVYGLPITIDPRDALIEEIARTKGHIVWLFEEMLTSEEQLTQPGWTRSDKDGNVTEGPTTKSIWMELYQQERAHYSSVASAAARAGVEERQIYLAEQYGLMLAQAVREIVDRLKLTKAQTIAFPGIARQVLSTIQISALPAPVEV